MGLVRFSSLLGAALVLATVSGGAQTATTATAEPDDCAADAKHLCADVEPGGGRLRECLATRIDELSHDCRARIEPTQREILAWRAACGADVDAKCKDEVGVGLGRCLERHSKTLAPACRVRTSAAPTYLALSCGEEVSSQCPGAQVGEGRYLSCIDQMADKLASPCAQVFEWYDSRYQKACAAAVAEYCGGEADYARSYPCLQSHRRQLPAACRRLVAIPPSDPPSGASSLGDGPFAGHYASNWGLVSCRQQQGRSKVDCSYEYGPGTLTCVANRNTLVCHWREGSGRGRATLVMGDGGHLTGTWGSGQRATGGGPWVFARLDRPPR